MAEVKKKTPSVEDETVPRQLTIWETSEPAQVDEVLIPVREEEIRWTKDITSLADVPVSMEKNIKPIDVVTQGIGNTTQVTTVLGKTILRMAPHPDWVMINGQVIQRKDLRDGDKAASKPIMVEMLTTVLYHGGVVKPFHMDVLHALLHGLLNRWEKTGTRSGTLTMTKTEIADIVNAELNGRVRKDIETALQTLQGLQIHKIYQPPKPGRPGHNQVGTVIQRMGGIIQNYAVRRGGGNAGRQGGGKPDLIEVDFNSGIVTALTSGADHRHWSLKPLNFTQTLRITEPWKRQLYRIIDSRFQQVGYLLMPMKELWIGCIGHDEQDALDPEKWRQARHRLRRVFKEFELTGYVVDLEMVTRRRNLKQEAGISKASEISIDLNEGGGMSAMIQATAPYSLDAEDEWIRCAPGPDFSAQAPKRKRDFALDLVTTLVGEDQAEMVLTALDVDAVIDISNGRMKAVINETGDLHKRMTQSAWFSESYPMSSPSFLIKHFQVEHTRRQTCATRGEHYEPIRAPFFHRRLEAVTRSIAKRFAQTGINIKDVAVGKQAVKAEDDDIAAALQLATKETAREIDPSPELLDEQFRMLYPEKEKSYQAILSASSEIGFNAGVMVKWFKFIRGKLADKLLKYGQKSGAQQDADAFYRIFWKENFQEIISKFPNSARLVSELERGWNKSANATANNLEIIVAGRVRRRIIEHLIEVHELEAVERREGIKIVGNMV